ncbi:hypothetical protein F1654_10165 [Alkalicaulis satelles]|uniref:Lipoprotein n=1 Tax=Alkalicaulis satelles TaxID=2609175 RepID=A0A5M6ZEF7_9PROT|nr:hypothetical protein [Alkalicaulis satelles]KAA5802197.1 hypothetical protein F1654_10165 [Alkalicaulis satelles]
MRVSSRHAALASVVAAGVMAACAAAPGWTLTPPSPPPPSHHHCCTHPGGPTIQPPSIHIGGPRIHVRGPNIHVGVHNSLNVNVNVQASASANAMAMASGQAGASTIVYAGGGHVSGGQAPAATALSGLRLAGMSERYEEERTRIREEWRLIRAICIDDRGAPHPAARPDPSERADPEFDGELFRCVPGTALQATMGWREDGVDRFEGGETIMCEKGEALRHEPGGRVFCARQSTQRDCHERSLLRLHGPGVKWVYMRWEERYRETRERRVASSEASSFTLMLDGGVGGYR